MSNGVWLAEGTIGPRAKLKAVARSIYSSTLLLMNSRLFNLEALDMSTFPEELTEYKAHVASILFIYT